MKEKRIGIADFLLIEAAIGAAIYVILSGTILREQGDPAVIMIFGAIAWLIIRGMKRNAGRIAYYLARICLISWAVLMIWATSARIWSTVYAVILIIIPCLLSILVHMMELHKVGVNH